MNAAGDFDLYFGLRKRYPDLTADEEKALGRAIRGGDRAAWETLVLSNVRLAVKFARRRCAWDGVLPVEDAAQEAVIAVMEAAWEFDPERGVRFATYAVWKIRAHMQAARVNYLPVRTPRNWAPDAGHPRPGSARAAVALARTVSLSEVVPDTAAEGEPLTWEAIFSCDGAADPAEAALEAERVERVREWLEDALPERRRAVVREVFGFDGEPKSNAEVGAEVGVSRERVRQLVEDSLKRLHKERRRVAAYKGD